MTRIARRLGVDRRTLLLGAGAAAGVGTTAAAGAGVAELAGTVGMVLASVILTRLAVTGHRPFVVLRPRRRLELLPAG